MGNPRWVGSRGAAGEMGGSVVLAEGGTVPPRPGSALTVGERSRGLGSCSTRDLAWGSRTGPGAGSYSEGGSRARSGAGSTPGAGPGALGPAWTVRVWERPRLHRVGRPGPEVSSRGPGSCSPRSVRRWGVGPIAAAPVRPREAEGKVAERQGHWRRQEDARRSPGTGTPAGHWCPPGSEGPWSGLRAARPRAGRGAPSLGPRRAVKSFLGPGQLGAH